MAKIIEGQTCPVCKAYLFEEDDVVFCPDCGAPHHRECYNSIGKCALEHLHGTNEQYSAPESKPEDSRKSETESETKKCMSCGAEMPKNSLFCSYCGRPSADPGFRGFANGPRVSVITTDVYGGYSPNKRIDGVTVKSIAKFVMVNTQRYIKRFVQLKDRKVSWNWLAFFFPESWFFLRKQYRSGFLAAVVSLASAVLTFPLNAVINTIASTLPIEYTYYDLVNAVSLQMGEIIGSQAFLLATLGTVLMLALRVICGMFGDKIYREFTISSIKKINSSNEEKELLFRKKGGVNPFLFLLSFYGINIVTNILVMFLS